MVQDTPPVTQETSVNKTDKTPATTGTQTLVGKARKYTHALLHHCPYQSDSRHGPHDTTRGCALPCAIRGLTFLSSGACRSPETPRSLVTTQWKEKRGCT